MVLYARCKGLHPDGEVCPLRDSCLRYTAPQGTHWLLPYVDDGHCFNRLTEMGLAMVEAMGDRTASA